MSIKLGLRMLSDEDEHFVRDYEVSYDMTLLDLHKFICEDLEYDEENLSSFFASNDRWEKLMEFTLVDMGAGEAEGSPLPMESVKIGQLMRQNNDRMIYVFDSFEDRAMFLELTGAYKKESGFEYPRVAFANGNPPDQFDASIPSGNRSIFEEAMGDYNEFEGDEDYDEDSI